MHSSIIYGSVRYVKYRGFAVRSPVVRSLRNILLAVASRDGQLLRRLATNLAEIDIVY
jgi:hypothetical protein